MKYTAIVLAAGKGSRMGGSVHKQFMELNGRPLVWYALHTFEKSCVDNIILVTGADEIAYCKKEIVEKYGFKKVSAVVAGGSERYLSVYEGLRAAEPSDIVLIHDGARPFVTQEIIARTIEAAQKYGSGVAAMPLKDTVKLADEQQFVVDTPPRDRMWTIQTPQTFSYPLILSAYEDVIKKKTAGITDDAMVLELAAQKRVRLVKGSYRNIKVTTPEDMEIASLFCAEHVL